MPTPLNPINLAAAVVGTTGSIDLTPCAPTSNPAYTNATATLQIYNDSACGLRLTGKNSGLAFDLPAGAWNNIAVPAGETEIDYVVLYVMQGPLVTTLLATYFAPNEAVPKAATVGNSPIGGTLSQATSVVQTGQPAGTSVVFAKPDSGLATTAEASINNDGTGYFGVGPSGLNPLKSVRWDNAGNELVWSLTEEGGGIAFTTQIKGPSGSKMLSDDGSGNALVGAATTPAKFTSDGQIFVSNNVQISGSIIEQTGHQETGKAGGIALATAGGQTFAFPVNFKTVMTNVPSSITLTASNSANNGGASASNIDKFGFFLVVTSSAAGGVDWRGTYTTVGN